MYPKVDEYSYPQPAPPAATGFPVSSANQYYPPPGSNASTFQLDSQATIPWSTGLCDCCDDPRNCCITCLCPCITFGRIAEIVDRGSTSCGASGALYTLILCVTGCQCLYSCFYRAKMRGQYMLKEGPCCDCLVHCCCEPCALCQEYRELRRRGFDMQIGWHANMERQGKGVTAPPPVQAGMTR